LFTHVHYFIYTYVDTNITQEEPTKQADPDVINDSEVQEVSVKEEEATFVDNNNDSDDKCEANNEKGDNNNDSDDKCEANNEKDDKVETPDNINVIVE